MVISVGESVGIGIGDLHRISNKGSERLIFIEVGIGLCLDENDIERIEDVYGRVGR